MSSEQMNSLKALYEEYLEDERFDHLRRPGINFVPGVGPLNPTLMLIGEAPGRMENAKGIPFVGKAGSHLTNLLLDVGIQPYDVFITNVVKYWPQDLEDENKTRTPTDEEIADCREYILSEIKIANPKIVGLCGRPAIRTVFPNINSVYKYHGQLLDSKYVPLYHPAVILYDQTKTKKAIVRNGFSQLKEHIDNLNREPVNDKC